MDQHLWSPEHYILTPKVVFQTWRNFNTFTFPRIRVALNHWFLHSTCFFLMFLGYAIGPPWPRCDVACVVLSSSARSWCLASHVLPNHWESQTKPVRVEHLDRRWLVFVQKICIFLKIFWFCVWVFPVLLDTLFDILFQTRLLLFFWYFFGVVIDLETLRQCKVQGLWIVLETQLTSRNVSCMLIVFVAICPVLRRRDFYNKQGMDMVIF